MGHTCLRAELRRENVTRQLLDVLSKAEDVNKKGNDADDLSKVSAATRTAEKMEGQVRVCLGDRSHE